MPKNRMFCLLLVVFSRFCFWVDASFTQQKSTEFKLFFEKVYLQNNMVEKAICQV